MKTLYLCLLMSFLFCSYGIGQHHNNKMSSKKSSVSSNNVIKESKVDKASHHKVKAGYESGKMHVDAKKYKRVDDVVVEKNIANAARVKKANFASSRKYKNRQQAYLNDLNSHSQNSNINKGKRMTNDGSFGF